MDSFIYNLDSFTFNALSTVKSNSYDRQFKSGFGEIGDGLRIGSARPSLEILRISLRMERLPNPLMVYLWNCLI